MRNPDVIPVADAKICARLSGLSSRSVVLTLQAFSWRSLRVHHLGRVVVLLSALPGAVCWPVEFGIGISAADRVFPASSSLKMISSPRIAGVRVAALIVDAPRP